MMNHTLNDSCYVAKILKTYGELNGELHLVELQREANAGLGLSLAGNRDLTTMSVFVVGIQPISVAAFSGLVHIGDELLEINGQVLYGRSHLNASAIIKAISSSHIKILLLRSEDCTERMAINPLQHSAVTYKDSSITLIPKKPKSLSLDDSQVQEDLSKTSETLKSRLECSKLSANNNSITTDTVATLSEIVTTATVHSLSSQQVNSKTENVEVIAHVISASPTLEKDNLTATSLCHSSAPVPSPGKGGRRLQKSAQVEDTEDEARKVQTERALVENDAQLKKPDAKLVDVINFAADPDEVSPETSTNSSSPLHPSGNATLEDPATCAIVSGRNNTIEIRKGKLGLGIKIIGGSDTILKAIIIYEIYKNGAAAKDGRLWPGDQILEINGQDLRDATHLRANQVLRQVAVIVKMVVFRDETVCWDDDLYDTMTIELVKKPGKGLGLSIISRKDNAGILISDIVKGGAADADGRLAPGDQILTINGDDMRKVTQEYAAELLKTSMGKIILTIGRLKVIYKPSSSRNSSGYNSRGIMKSESNASDCRSTGKRTTKRNGIGCHSVVQCLQPQD